MIPARKIALSADGGVLTVDRTIVNSSLTAAVHPGFP